MPRVLGLSAAGVLAAIVIAVALPWLLDAPERPAPPRGVDRPAGPAPAPTRDDAEAGGSPAPGAAVPGDPDAVATTPDDPEAGIAENAGPRADAASAAPADELPPPPAPVASPGSSERRSEPEPAEIVDPLFEARAGVVTALEQWVRAYESLDSTNVLRADPSTPDVAALQAAFDALDAQQVQLLEPEISIADDHRGARVRGILRFGLLPKGASEPERREVRARFDLVAAGDGAWRILESELAPLPAEEAIDRLLDEWERAHETLDAAALRAVQPGLADVEALQSEMSNLAWQRIEREDQRVYLGTDGRTATVNCTVEWESLDRTDGTPRRRTLLGTFRVERDRSGWVLTAVELY